MTHFSVEIFSVDGRIMERAQSEVRYQYDKNIKPSSVLLVTWVNMQPVGEQSVKQDVREKITSEIFCMHFYSTYLKP